MGLSFRIRQDNLTSNRVAITLIFWHNPVSCNISPCLVWMIRTAILCFDTFQSHILFFRIILNPFHAGLCHKFLVGNIFGDILCSHCLLRNFRHRMLRFFLTFFFCHSILWNFIFCRMDIRQISKRTRTHEQCEPEGCKSCFDISALHCILLFSLKIPQRLSPAALLSADFCFLLTGVLSAHFLSCTF